MGLMTVAQLFITSAVNHEQAFIGQQRVRKVQSLQVFKSIQRCQAWPRYFCPSQVKLHKAAQCRQQFQIFVMNVRPKKDCRSQIGKLFEVRQTFIREIAAKGDAPKFRHVSN